MARNEKEYKHRGIKKHRAQSTLEYALILPFLILIILAIIELAFMWHQLYSAETAVREISANIATIDNYNCSIPDDPVNETDLVKELIENKTSFLQMPRLNFSASKNGNNVVYTSNEQYKGRPFVRATIDCTQPAAVSVQLRVVHKLIFFASSLPNFRDASRIVIIPDNVLLTTTKTVTVSKN